MRVIRISVLVILISILLSVVAFAENTSPRGTTGDLLNLLGIGDSVDSVKLQAEYESTYRTYVDAVNKTVMTESYNSLIDIGNSKIVEQESVLRSSIESLEHRNKELYSCITVGIEDSIDVLLKYDIEYKQNITNLNKLYSTLDACTTLQKLEVPVSDLTGLKSKLNEQEKLKKAVRTSVLGEVSNIRHPLLNEKYVTSGFGTRVNPLTLKGSQFHNGVDFRAVTGTTVIAQFNGTVSAIGTDYAIGTYVKLDHGDGVYTIYGHLSNALVKVGDVVSQYSSIALSGNSGANTTGPHLHIGLYIDGIPYNLEPLYA